MTKLVQKKDNNLSIRIINILVVFFIASNLRTPITSIGPVLTDISNELQLSNLQSSLLTSIPLLMFAGFSIIVSRFTYKLSILQILILGLIILALGSFLRIYGDTNSLILGSFLVGFGICIGNVITPGFIKNNFPKNLGLMTGLFAVGMNLSAAFASGYSIKIGEWTKMGWRGSIGIWSLLVCFTLLLLFLKSYLNKRKNTANNFSQNSSTFRIFKSKQAWNISIFMGLQSLVYYCVVAWFPVVLNEFGLENSQTGWVLFIFQIATIPLTFLGPVLANKMKNQKLLIVFATVVMFLSICLFAFWKLEFMYLAAALLGISNGLAFSLSLLFFSIKTQNTEHAIKLSGMAQSIGYLIAAVGPPIFGHLHSITISWEYSFYFLLVVVLIMLFFGLKASKYIFVEER